MSSNKRLTPKEKVFSETLANYGSPEFAAIKAKMAHPETNGYHVARRPHIQDSVRRAQMRRLTDDVLPKAVGVLEKILEDTTARNADRIQAAKVVMTYTIGRADADGAEKAPEDMTADELTARITALRARQVELSNAAQVIDVEPVAESSAESDVFG